MSFVLTALFPGDVGDSCVHYAAGLALALQRPLHIVLPYTVPLAVGEMPMPLLPVEEVRDAAQQRLTALQKDFTSRYPALQIRAELAYGMTQDALQDAAGRGAQGDVLTVVSIGDPAQADNWFSSESVQTMRENQGLVLAVPRGLSFRIPRHVCLACDSKGLHEGVPLQDLLTLKLQFHFRLTVLHVMQAGAVATDYPHSKLYEQLSGSAAAFAEIATDGAIDVAMASYVQAQAVDWVVLSPHHHGFWEGLFRRSHTARMLSLAQVPVVALHK